MAFRQTYAFRTIRGSSDISFASTSSSVAELFALESTALGRVFGSPAGRTVRLSCGQSTMDYFVKFGSSDVVAESTNSLFMLGGTVETFHVEPGQTHISLVSTGDGNTINITLGHGS